MKFPCFIYGYHGFTLTRDKLLAVGRIRITLVIILHIFEIGYNTYIKLKIVWTKFRKFENESHEK